MTKEIIDYTQKKFSKLLENENPNALDDFMMVLYNNIIKTFQKFQRGKENAENN